MPVPLFQEGIVEVIQPTPQERISEHIVEQVVKNVPKQRISERTLEQFADVPVPRILKEIVAPVSRHSGNVDGDRRRDHSFKL